MMKIIKKIEIIDHSEIYKNNYVEEDEEEERLYFNLLTDEMILQADAYGYAVCPLCKEEKERDSGYKRIYDKRKVSVNEYRNFGYCHRCNSKFYREKELVKEYYNTAPILRNFSFKDYEEFELTYINCNFLNEKLNILSDECLQYLLSRCKYYDKEFLYKFNFHGEYNSIYIPFIVSDDIFYYQVRFINNNFGMKYFFPPSDNKPLYVNNYSRLKPTFLVEGVFDTLAINKVFNFEYNVVAILGSTISSYQYEMLSWLGLSDHIIVMMDDVKKSKDLCKKLRNKKYKGKLSYVKVYHDQDPEELLNQLGIEGLKDYINFNKELYSFQKKKAYF